MLRKYQDLWDMVMKIKVCNICGIEKHISEYHKKKGGRYGVAAVCKDCRNLQSKKWRKETGYHKKYYEDNKEELLEKQRQHRLDNLYEYREKEKLRARITNPKRRWYNKQWREANRDRLLVEKRKDYINNREYYLELSREWRKNNRDKKNAYEAKRKATKLKQTPKLTIEEQNTIKLYYRLSQSMGYGYHVDHVTPLDAGGLHHPNNLQILHKYDNLSKNSKTKYEYRHPRYIIKDNQLIKII